MSLALSGRIHRPISENSEFDQSHRKCTAREDECNKMIAHTYAEQTTDVKRQCWQEDEYNNMIAEEEAERLEGMEGGAQTAVRV